MKTRNGFVSNSSSASFVVHWRHRDFGKEIEFREIVQRLRGWAGWDSDKQKEIEDTDFMDTIVDKTNRNEDGTYTTEFFTGMMNSASDFGTTAQLFVMSLLCEDEFEMIDYKVDSE